MIIVVMMTLARWDDRGRGEEMNQEKADQDVADEVSEEADSRGNSSYFKLPSCSLLYTDILYK